MVTKKRQGRIRFTLVQALLYGEDIAHLYDCLNRVSVCVDLCLSVIESYRDMLVQDTLNAHNRAEMILVCDDLS